MDPDKYQQAWQAQSSQTRVTVDADLLFKVQRSQRQLRATILRRDVVEVGVGLLLLTYWIYQGITKSLPWTWWLGVPAIIWVVGFILVDRMRHPQTPSDLGEPLLIWVKNSLNQVEHQIWLLRNIFWWYLLPFTIALMAFFGHVVWQTGVATNNWLVALAFGAFLFVIVGAVYSFIYNLNQRAVRTQLEPRRQELLKLLASLGDETTSEVIGDYPGSQAALADFEKELLALLEQGQKIQAIKLYREQTGTGLKDAKDAVEALAFGGPLQIAKSVKCSPRRRFVDILCAVAMLVFPVFAFLIINHFAWAVWEWALFGVATLALAGFFALLLVLLARRGDDTTSEVSGEHPIRMGTKRCETSPRLRFVVSLCLVAILMLAELFFLIIIRFAWAAQR